MNHEVIVSYHGMRGIERSVIRSTREDAEATAKVCEDALKNHGYYNFSIRIEPTDEPVSRL